MFAAVLLVSVLFVLFANVAEFVARRTRTGGVACRLKVGAAAVAGISEMRNISRLLRGNCEGF